MNWMIEHAILVDVIQYALFLIALLLVAKIAFDAGRDNRRPLNITIELEGADGDDLLRHLSTSIFEQMTEQGHNANVVFVTEGGPEDACDRKQN